MTNRVQVLEEALRRISSGRSSVTECSLIARQALATTAEPHGAREETTFDEVVRAIRDGSFYEDYDWASGPALRALERAEAALSQSPAAAEVGYRWRVPLDADCGGGMSCWVYSETLPGFEDGVEVEVEPLFASTDTAERAQEGR